MKFEGKNILKKKSYSFWVNWRKKTAVEMISLPGSLSFYQTWLLTKEGKINLII